MGSNLLIESMLPVIESKLQQVVSHLEEPRTRLFHDMLTYHLGWSGVGAGPETTGKRIRPLLVLLTCAACGENWQNTLPAAACLELIHNFSLAHDDIQDDSELRRGRFTIWKKWGVAQAINVGDALFILAQLTLLELNNNYPPEIIMKVGELINKACLQLSTGQFLDLTYEDHIDMTIEDYWPMVSGKTAALMSACTQIGSILGGADPIIEEKYRSFGHFLGLAFQVQDDFLGIWGKMELTGKSIESDLVARKKTLPVLFGLSKQGEFAHRWAEGPISFAEAGDLSVQLAKEGAKLYTQRAADQMTDLSLQFLRSAAPQGEASEALYDLVNILLDRQA
jgi:geranylgeranyl diphosphate synthase type I